MSDKALLIKSLLETLTRVDFSFRYYEFCDEHSAPKSGWVPTRAELEKTLASTSLSFSYDERERFFNHVEPLGMREISLRVAFPAGLEMLLYIDTEHGYIGGPYAMLARQAAQMADPSFSHSPPYPKLPAADLNQLAEGVRFGVSLFDRIKKALSTAPEWHSSGSGR